VTAGRAATSFVAARAGMGPSRSNCGDGHGEAPADTCHVSWLEPPGPPANLRNQWSCESVRGSVSLLRLPAFAKPRLTM